MPFRSSLADIESNASVFHSRTPPRPGCPPERTPKYQDNRSRRRREQAGDQIPLRGQGVLGLGQLAHSAIRRTGRFLSPRRGAAPRNLSWSRSVDFDGLTRDPGDPGPGDLVRECLDIQDVGHLDRVCGPAAPAGAGDLESAGDLMAHPDDNPIRRNRHSSLNQQAMAMASVSGF